MIRGRLGAAGEAGLCVPLKDGNRYELRATIFHTQHWN
jgi:hypothetical protein